MMAGAESFDRFFAEFSNPFDFLNTRDEVVLGLVEPFGSRQGNLFDTGESASTLFHETEVLHSKGRLYRSWEQVVGSKERRFAVPNSSFRKLIDQYLLPLIKQKATHGKSHGGERGWTPRSSLESHLPVGCVFSFDLANAFNNVGIREVYDFFYGLFENLEEGDRVGSAGLFATLLTVTYNDKRSLPQGSPSSMALFNRLLLGVDAELDRKAGERGLNYTRWVDDITISSPRERQIGDFLGAAEIVDRKFPVARQKVFFQGGKNPIYLLGHVIEGGRIYKNSPEDREENKTPPLNYDSVMSSDFNRW